MHYHKEQLPLASIRETPHAATKTQLSQNNQSINKKKTGKKEERRGQERVQAHRAHGGVPALGEVKDIDSVASAHPHGGAAWLMEKHRVWLS